ncbi:radial spoke head 10 homolog B isoform X1 [Dunckerocampus dactyliophorus]|uniref:radial spoke head 10 homolog B isoform X1 n=1 Tax=Dunckerocampus dactyliophorus TaxID=161453 RepID=UPI002404D2C2|nr:radial spoke head 10 homolog B isoform X1 [Dunckerocampus dactyliophorus]
MQYQSRLLQRWSANFKQAQPGGDQQHSCYLFDLPSYFVLTFQRYEGEAKDGQFHGRGFARFKGGHVYKGMFSMGLMHGTGVFTWADGVKYEGEFVLNIPMGQGMYIWPDGSSYKGDVCNGVRHGDGTHKDGKGKVTYKGQWNHSKRHGKGTVYYNQEETSWYKGDWVMNKREGWGIRRYPSGNIYFGEWRNHLRHGEGTMRWQNVGQLYIGHWLDGVQHGQGTHVWLVKRTDGSEFRPSNQYTGNFFLGQRNGQGIFYYAGGATYEGGWINNKKHGKGKVTLKDGSVLEGQFINDKMVTPDVTANRAPVRQGLDESTLGPDMTVNIDCVLEKFPQRKQDNEHKQVRFVLLRHKTELRAIYRFYSRLGHRQTPGSAFLLSRMQLWRLLKDCRIHHRGITLTELDLYIRDNPDPAEVHSPFTPIMLCRFLSCLVVIAYHIYQKDIEPSNYLLASCFSKLLTDDIFPNATNVKGFLFNPPGHAVVAVDYLMRSLEVYQAYCRVSAAPRDDSTMTNRHMLLLYKDLNICDSSLTISNVMQIICAESLDPSNMSPCMELEITFLEFFEVLLGCAEIKCQEIADPYPKTRLLLASSAVPRKWQQLLVKFCQQEAWSRKIHHFFNHFFFPAVKLLQLV